MKKWNCPAVYCLLFALLLHLPFSSCRRSSSVPQKKSVVQVRFDSAYQFVVNNMLVSSEHIDTFVLLCDEMMSVPPSLLEPRQLKLWAHSFALASSVYFNNNNLKKGLSCLQRGIEVADSLDNMACFSRISGMLALVYSNWRLDNEANILLTNLIENSDKNDSLTMGYLYLSKAIHMVYTMKYDSAVYYLNQIDRLGLTEKDMLPGSYKSVSYAIRFYKGWCFAELPDSLSAAIGLLQGLYDEYQPNGEQVVAFESVCFRLGRAYDLAGKTTEAWKYYEEAKDKILLKPISFQLFETSSPLMNIFLRAGRKEDVMQLLPVWKRIMEQYYDNKLRGMLAYYSVKLDVMGKEKQVMQAKAALDKREMETVVLALALVALIIFVVWSIVYFRYKKRQFRLLFKAQRKQNIEWCELNLPSKSGRRNLAEKMAMEEERTEVYEGTGLKDNEEGAKEEAFYRQLYQKVLVVMEQERPFLNPDLNLVSLARMAGSNRTHLSLAINRMTGNNFSTWLAEYRVNYAMHLMNTSESVNLDTLYEQAGFGSRTTFFRQFKQNTGLTPKQFLKQQMK